MRRIFIFSKWSLNFKSRRKFYLAAGSHQLSVSFSRPNTPFPPQSKRPPTRARRTRNSIAQARAVERHTQQSFQVNSNSLIRSIIPDRFSCVLKYASSKSYTTGIGGIVGATQTYRLNGLFDPDITGVGHQPYGFDQITPFFSVYTVKKVWANVTVTGVDDASTFLAWSIQPSVSTTALAGMGIEQVSESDETNFVVLGANSGGVPNQQIKFPKVDLAQLEGLPLSAYLGNVNFRSAKTANPGQGAQLQIGIGSIAGAAAKVATLTVELFFEAVFEGRQSMPQS